MKKTLLTSAILAALASGSVNAAEVYKDETHSVDLYGKVQGMYYTSDDNSEEGDTSYFRLGVKAKSAITEQAYGFARFEVEWAANKSATYDVRPDNDIRLGFAGIGHKTYGELSYGRQYGAYTLVADYTDVLFEFGGDASGTGTDAFGTGKSDAVLKYAVGFNGLEFQASYQVDNKKEDSLVDGDKKANSFGVAASYNFDDLIGIEGFNLGAAYNNGERLTSGTKDTDMTAVAINYDANNIYAAFLYSTGTNWNKKKVEYNTEYNGYEAALGYSFDNGLDLIAGYDKQDKKDKYNGKSREDSVEYYTVSAAYKFNKQFQVGAEYLFNQIDDEEDVLALAAIYKF